MSTIRNTVLLTALFCLVYGPSTLGAEPAAEVKMSLLPSGAMPKLGGYRPQLLKLTADKPAELKKSPELQAPLYGSIRFGGKSYLVALDEPAGKDAKLYVDANGNGDLTDDPPCAWSKRTVDGPDDLHLTTYNGGFKLPLQTVDQPALVSLSAYRFDKNDPRRAALKTTLLYYNDYAYDGQIILNGVAYHAMLADDFATGDFRGKKDAPGGTGVRLLIDVNGDGRFDSRGETFDPAKPFNIKGNSWIVADLTAGGSFKIAKSDEAVAEILPPPDLSVGKKITPFKATKMDGSPVNFPDDYKGKVVMLDFWATWCGPCMGEVPGLVKVYNDMHAKGFEILGISLDQPNAADRVKSVTADKGMTWPQVYDGKFWKAEVADSFGIESIPSAFLVKGDTGEILAAGESLRGENLAGTINNALGIKGAPQAAGENEGGLSDHDKMLQKMLAARSLVASRAATQPSEMFWYTYVDGVPRLWLKTDETHWEENYPDGHADSFLVMRTILKGQTPGTVVRRLPDTGFEVLIPSQDGQPLLFHFNPTESWRGLGPVHFKIPKSVSIPEPAP